MFMPFTVIPYKYRFQIQLQVAGTHPNCVGYKEMYRLFLLYTHSHIKWILER